MSVEGKNVIFVLGGPGSGKGTQAIGISREFGFGYAAAGDLLREEVKKPDSPNGKRIQELMTAGKLVPPELLVSTLRNAIRVSPAQYFLLDGFPRSIAQDDSFRAEAGLPTTVILLDVPDDVLRARLSSRSLTSGRADDDAAIVEKRLLTHKQDSIPVLERYAAEGLLSVVNGNQSIEDVHAEFVAVLRRFWQF
jgi:adenylate kinase family enzyme